MEVPNKLTGYIAYFEGSWKYYWLAETKDGIAFLPLKPEESKPFFYRDQGVRTMIKKGAIVLAGDNQFTEKAASKQP